jgi:hypothetical protein
MNFKSQRNQKNHHKIPLYPPLPAPGRKKTPKGETNTTPTIHKIPLIPPLPKAEIVIPLFGKEGRGEIF